MNHAHSFGCSESIPFPDRSIKETTIIYPISNRAWLILVTGFLSYSLCSADSEQPTQDLKPDENIGFRKDLDPKIFMEQLREKHQSSPCKGGINHDLIFEDSFDNDPAGLRAAAWAQSKKERTSIPNNNISTNEANPVTPQDNNFINPYSITPQFVYVVDNNNKTNQQQQVFDTILPAVTDDIDMFIKAFKRKLPNKAIAKKRIQKAKDEHPGLGHIIKQLKDPEHYARVKYPSRLLFIGPSGCGKTTTAEALAKYCGMTCIFIKASSIATTYQLV